MKMRFKIFMVSMFFSTLSLFSQDHSNRISEKALKSGVYLTYSDYKQNKLSYESDCKNEKYIIKLNEFLDEPFITVKHKNEKIKLQKDRIYGVVECDEPLIRFQDKVHYTLAEKCPLWIFYREVHKPLSKGINNEKQFYFATKGDGRIIELTSYNIKQAFPHDHKLHDLIDAEFANHDLSEYDSFNKMYKVNHLINSTSTKGDKCSICSKK